MTEQHLREAQICYMGYFQGYSYPRQWRDVAAAGGREEGREGEPIHSLSPDERLCVQTRYRPLKGSEFRRWSESGE